MLPYEILVGLRGSMQTSARGLIRQQRLLRQPNIDVQSLYNFSTHIKCNSRLVYKDINVNNIKRFHTQLLANCQAGLKDSKPSDFEDASQQETDPFNNFIDSVGRKQTLESESSQDGNMLRIPEQTKKWLFSDLEKAPAKEIERRFPEPKVFLHNLFAVVSNETNIQHCLTSTTKHADLKNKQGWMFTYQIQWPEKMSFSAKGNSKASASLSAALKTLYWLHINGRIKGRFPVVYQKQETLSLLNMPEEFNIEEKVLGKIGDFLTKYETQVVDAVTKSANQDTEKFVTDKLSSDRHPISNNYVDVDTRNKILLDRLNNRRVLTNPELPIIRFKDQILKELDENQAVVIKGDTGCGKTTQVPQFIMDYFIEKGQAANCSMVVTQPRRISAISLAQRIAYERGESVGDVVGYQVRLQQVLPRQKGAILFCTTGILLKKLQTNLKLEGCSHIIVDEAHERSVDTDMLLVLLRRAMQINPSLKVVIMSATINADLFQEYLGCNAVDVPGRLYPVKMHFMDEISQFIPPSQRFTDDGNDGPVVNTDQITDLIRWISENKPPGSILCFLPGWSHILRIQNNLEEYSTSNQLVIPLHSKIPYAIQSKIFDPPPEGVRKIILATDIAETGITVPDVVYVIDSACHKEVRWHENKGLSSIDTHWISKANMNQRKGRAGRVQEGESFHFITKKQYEELDPYPIPEVLRVSLEKTVLDGKTYSNEKAENFLGSMPQPPRLSAVKKAVNDLQELGALDENQDLTALGKRIAMFTIHPKLSKAMVYSSVFQCMSPVTTVSAALSLDSEIFYGTLDNKSRIRETKKRFHPTSDHLAIAWIYNQWLDINRKNGSQNAYQFSRRNGLHAERMNILHKVRDINLEHLRESGMIANVQEASDLNCEENQFAILDELVRGILLSGMDQILKHRNFEIRKGRFTKSGTSMVTEDNAKAQLTPECVNHKRTSWPSPFLIYYQKTHHHERRTTLIRESSMISPITVLLFSQGRVTGSMHNDKDTGAERVLLKIHGKENVHLMCDEATAQTILRFRDLMWLIVRYYVERNVTTKSLYYSDLTSPDDLAEVKRKMLEVLALLLSSSANSIDEVIDTPTNNKYNNFGNNNFSNSGFSYLNRPDDGRYR
ncbi:hypothetical protein TSAR_011903 [Trichomalopsis sarcophagae]|uniref:RNA helicase n=1 Tax=Trichomalopsis sarcophagae TaxID=543379 RepID=A0A232F3R9_9HYME|nr:hypothetical protein TSAR_011903 [Trichomalopsis sarcophagae]